MAGQKTVRPAKRHLVRWNDTMDKQLLLTIQQQCNVAGVRLPWDAIGSEMGQYVTEGAVIQHLAKLRCRMVEQGVRVPPPLRRGGAGRGLSTGGPTAVVTPSSIYRAKRNRQAKSTSSPGTARGNEEDDEEDFDVDKASDPDEDFIATRVKRVKEEQGKKNAGKKFKDDDSSDEDIKAKITLAKKNAKRNIKNEHSSDEEYTKLKSMLGKNVKTKVGVSRWGRYGRKPARAAARRGAVKGEDSSESEEGSDGEKDVKTPESDRRVAAGASFLKIEKRYDNDSITETEAGSPTQEPLPIKKQGGVTSKVVILRLGRTEAAIKELSAMKYEDDMTDTNMSDSGSSDDVKTEAEGEIISEQAAIQDGLPVDPNLSMDLSVSNGDFSGFDPNIDFNNSNNLNTYGFDMDPNQFSADITGGPSGNIYQPYEQGSFIDSPALTQATVPGNFGQVGHRDAVTSFAVADEVGYGSSLAEGVGGNGYGSNYNGFIGGYGSSSQDRTVSGSSPIDPLGTSTGFNGLPGEEDIFEKNLDQYRAYSDFINEGHL